MVRFVIKRMVLFFLVAPCSISQNLDLFVIVFASIVLRSVGLWECLWTVSQEKSSSYNRRNSFRWIYRIRRRRYSWFWLSIWHWKTYHRDYQSNLSFPRQGMASADSKSEYESSTTLGADNLSENGPRCTAARVSTSFCCQQIVGKLNNAAPNRK